MDVVTRAVRMICSEKAAAYIECSECASPALRLNTASLKMGSSKGIWSRNEHVGALFLRSAKLTDTETFALIVSKGAVVLSAQHIIWAGIEHDMKAKGFKRGLRALTHHVCSICARERDTSIRLRVDACAKIAVEVDYMDSVTREAALDDAKVRLQCSTCSHQLQYSGPSTNSIGGVLPDRARTLLPPAPALSNKNQSAKTAMTAMGQINVPPDVNDTQRLGQLLYFSRNTGKPTETGVLVWVVDQALPVVQVADMTSVFEPASTSYEFKPLNAQCHAHKQVFPQACAICAQQIHSEEQAVMADGLRGHVHAGCSQRCTMCASMVARLGPTPEEATFAELCIALPAQCVRCAANGGGGGGGGGVAGKHAGDHEQPTCKTSKLTQFDLAQPGVGDKPGKASAAMLREKALNALKIKSTNETGTTASKSGFQERWIGDCKQGLYPGGSGIFRMADDTLALKLNKDGVIVKKPVCGYWFREQDGSLSVYEWGVRVQHEPV